jgi:hypothetical protein
VQEIRSEGYGDTFVSVVEIVAGTEFEDQISELTGKIRIICVILYEVQSSQYATFVPDSFKPTIACFNHLMIYIKRFFVGNILYAITYHRQPALSV